MNTSTVLTAALVGNLVSAATFVALDGAKATGRKWAGKWQGRVGAFAFLCSATILGVGLPAVLR